MRSAPPVDELYLAWLAEQVEHQSLRRPRAYWSLLQQLYRKEFVWFIPNDDNRAEDGKLLRFEFITGRCPLDVDQDWMSLGCSMLELLVGLSRRLSFDTEMGASDWFWILLRNIGLAECWDSPAYPSHQIDQILERVIWRTYDPDGVGGLFPLRRPNGDQRKVELWYQLSAYLLE